MTGTDAPDIRTAAFQSGSLACLTKPFSAQALTEPLQKRRRSFRRPLAYSAHLRTDGKGHREQPSGPNCFGLK
jgi:hypothetical protein